ncbi:MAG: hypothetical protein GC180_08400 [Bacteroidetes bacterium]|nr:hypothetical protein [Bacteroidota bacterium]
MFRFIKTPSHRKFDHTPIYYNPEKEDLKRTVAEAEGKQNPLSQGVLKERWARNHDRLSVQNRASNVRIILIAAILAVLVWWIFFAG